MDLISLFVYWRRTIFVNRFKIRGIRAIRQICDSDKRKERERRLGSGNLTTESCLNHGLTGLLDDTDFEKKQLVVVNFYGSSPVGLRIFTLKPT